MELFDPRLLLEDPLLLLEELPRLTELDDPRELLEDDPLLTDPLLLESLFPDLLLTVEEDRDRDELPDLFTVPRLLETWPDRALDRTEPLFADEFPIRASDRVLP